MSAPDGLITCLQCSTLKCYYEYEVQEQGPGNRMVKYQDELHDNIDTWRMFCFHFDCHNCPPSKKLDSLCEKCCHLRLRHIVRCGLYNYFAPENEGNRTRGTGLVFDLGTLEQVRESASHCVMCEVFANVAQAQNKPQALPDHILEIYIDLSKRSLLNVNYSFKLGLRLKDGKAETFITPSPTSLSHTR
ncbi:HET-domain-containing protein [Penicillium angulare]|uniref:HET-domain-containing protein n=1 Tax=Penicillium angulare TaxID=116970 RepID=A0A9W9FHR7_9EURO|nr:HET-domain-containing protein [Penicillium angulare]